MKMQQLEYVIAIAHAGSITAAAKNLYQAQPNISIALKELESEIGMQIFWRTPNGMVLTPEGESFLLRAKDIVESMHSLENDYTNRGENGISVRISSVRSAYMSVSLGQWINSISGEEKISLQFIENISSKVIDDVSTGKADIGVFRVPGNQLDVFMEQMESRKMYTRVLAEFSMAPLMSADHPLAKLDDIPLEELKKYPEIVHADDEMSVFDRSYVNPDYENASAPKRIYVYDNGSKMIMLATVKDSYMWSSPGLPMMPVTMPMVSKKCSQATLKTCDIIMCKKSAESNRVIKSCMDFISDFVDGIGGEV